MKKLNCIFRISVTIFLISIVSIEVKSQNDRPFSKPCSETLLDTTVYCQKLANGLTYYIKRNENPKGRVSLYFVTKGGYNAEKADQFDLSHLLEHMPFVGTKHFKSPRECFQKGGLKPGVDFNAHPHPDYTYYYVQNISAFDTALIDSALLFLRDCSNGILLDSSKVAVERNVVLEELRRGSIADLVIQGYYMDSVISNPAYRYRKIQERIWNLNNFRQRSILNFYHEWYRPDVQSVVVVGDVNIDYMDRQIRTLFSGLTNPAREKTLVVYPESKWKSNVIIIANDNVEEFEVDVIMKKRHRPLKTVDDYRFFVMTELVNTALRYRFMEFKSSPKYPFESIHSSYNNRFNENGPVFGALQTSIKLRGNLIEDGFVAGMIELKRIQKHGFTEAELKNAKEQFLKGVNLNSFGHSKAISSELVLHFVRDHVVVSPEYKLKLFNHLISQISLEPLNAFVKTLITDRNRDIILKVPGNINSDLLNESTVLNWLKEVNSALVEPYIDDLAGIVPLMSMDEVSKLSSKAEFETTTINELGLTKIRLKNGINVLLKQIDERRNDRDKVFIHGSRNNGKLSFPIEDYYSATYAGPFVVGSGLGPFNNSDFKKFLTEKEIRLFPYIAENESGIRGESPMDKLEILLQTVYLYLSQPQRDDRHIQDCLDKIRKDNRALLRDPKDVIDSILCEVGVPKFRKLRSNDVSQIDVDRAYRIYQEIFSDTEDFTFAIAGNLDLPYATRLIVKYLGSLSSENHRPGLGAPLSKFAPSKITKNIYADQSDDKAEVNLYFIGSYNKSQVDEFNIDILTRVLQLVLRKRLREVEGAVYSVNVFALKSSIGVYNLHISFDCAPERAPDMLTFAREEIKEITSKMLSKEILEQVKGLESRWLQDVSGDAQFWVNYLTSHPEIKSNILSERQTLLNELTLQTIEHIAQKYLSDEGLVEILVLPKNDID